MSDKHRAEVAEGYMVKLNAEITTLRAQLKRHGGHTAECASLEIWAAVWIERSWGPEQQKVKPKKCNCNWADIEKVFDC